MRGARHLLLVLIVLMVGLPSAGSASTSTVVSGSVTGWNADTMLRFDDHVGVTTGIVASWSTGGGNRAYLYATGSDDQVSYGPVTSATYTGSINPGPPVESVCEIRDVESVALGWEDWSEGYFYNHGAYYANRYGLFRNSATGFYAIIEIHQIDGEMMDITWWVQTDGSSDFGPCVTNEPPVAHPGGPYVIAEGSSVTFDGSASHDPDGDSLMYRWDLDDDGTWDLVGEQPTVGPGWDGPLSAHPVVLEVTDPSGATDTAATTLTVTNVAPSVGPISLNATLVEVGTAVAASADFTDPGVTDTHTATWDWGDAGGPGTLVQGAGSGTVTDTHTYLAAGVYAVWLTVVDDDGGVGSAHHEYVVVYDPTAGFVTGGGWIDSPSGAFGPDPTLGGKASFGFVSKYTKGASTPAGNTEFQFETAGLTFNSSGFDWLVVTGSDYAMFQGVGAVNGVDEYKFKLWAGDGEVDTFRIKIWTEDDLGNESTLYDNGSDQPIGGGSIVVHTKKK